MTGDKLQPSRPLPSLCFPSVSIPPTAPPHPALPPLGPSRHWSAAARSVPVKSLYASEGASLPAFCSLVWPGHDLWRVSAPLKEDIRSRVTHCAKTCTRYTLSKGRRPKLSVFVPRACSFHGHKVKYDLFQGISLSLNMLVMSAAFNCSVGQGQNKGGLGGCAVMKSYCYKFIILLASA